MTTTGYGRGLSPEQWAELRQAVLLRDLWQCRYCGAPARLIDRVTPGPATSSNAVACCTRCLALSRRAHQRFTDLDAKRAWVQAQLDQVAKRRGGNGQSGPVAPPALVIPDEKPATVRDRDWNIVRALRVDRLSKHRVRDRFRVSYNEIARAEARVWEALPLRDEPAAVVPGVVVSEGWR
jgi:hypothetical protein